MRKIGMAVVAATVMFAGSQAHAEGYGMAGCGLGSLLFKTDNSKSMQVLASTTNNILVPQTFAISSGTSNCVEGGVLKSEREQAAFAEVNFLELKRNMAMGGGEYLSSFSTLLGCTEASKTTLFKMTQDKYEAILPSASTTPIAMLKSVKEQIKATPALASSCSDERAMARASGKPATTSVAMAKSNLATSK
jgi:DUF3015 family protein